jgi:hypothetical protein
MFENQANPVALNPHKMFGGQDAKTSCGQPTRKTFEVLSSIADSQSF